jgi:hypothetical protein
MQLKDNAPPVFITADAGVVYAPARMSDPIADWMNLMEAAEALCPRWPERELSMGMRFEL